MRFTVWTALALGSLALAGCGSGAGPGAEGGASRTSAWQRFEKTDDFTDEKSIHYQTRDGRLSLNCLEQYKYVGLSITSEQDSNLTESKVEFPSRVRVDKGDIFDLAWWVYPSQGIITPQTANAGTLIDHMKGGTTLAVEFWPGAGNSMKMSFDIAGFDEAYADLKQFCSPESGATDQATAAASESRSVADQAMAEPATQQGGASCASLWRKRNQIYADKGFCFKSARAIADFGEACFPPYGQLSEAEKATVDDIKRQERALACAEN